MTRADKLKVAYFAQHQLDELKPSRQPLRSHARADAGCRRRRRCAPASAPSDFPGRLRIQRWRTLSGGEKARLLLGSGDLRWPSPCRARRADQPSRHRQPRRADRSDQRLSRRGRSWCRTTAICWKPAPTGCGASPMAALRRSTATSTTTAASCCRERRRNPQRAEARTQHAPGAPNNAAPRPRSAPSSRRCSVQIKNLEADMARHGARIAEIDRTLADPQLYVRDRATRRGAQQGTRRRDRRLADSGRKVARAQQPLRRCDGGLNRSTLRSPAGLAFRRRLLLDGSGGGSAPRSIDVRRPLVKR